MVHFPSSTCPNKNLWRLVALASLVALIFCIGTEVRRLSYHAKFDLFGLDNRVEKDTSKTRKGAITVKTKKPEDVHTDDPEVIKRRKQAESVREQQYIKYIKTYTFLETSKREKRVADVIGIGVEKCGSGPLQWMLTHHPMIIGSSPIELHFFGSGNERKGAEAYRRLMPEVARYELASEKTPAYFNFGPRNLPMAMKEIVPNAKLILILCDPVNRTYSDFIQEKLMGALRHDALFEPIIEGLLEGFSNMPVNDEGATTDFLYKEKTGFGKTHIISTGLYYYYLLRWFEAYDRSQIHIVNGEDLLSDPGTVMEKIQDFLKIPKLIIKEDFVRDSSGFFCINAPKPSFTGTEIKIERPKDAECIPLISKGRTRNGRWQYKPSEAVMEKLKKFFEPHNKKLFDLLGRKFDWQQPSS